MIDGLLVVDKPTGMTSHDVVSFVRRLVRQKRVGHAGTLDPDATGVLIVGLGRATKLLTYLVGESKTYRAVIRLGVRTVTEDAAGQWVDSIGAVLDSPAGLPDSIREPRSGMRVSVEQIDRAISALTGEILQVPSKVSAIKIAGKRAYARVRDGEEVQLAARPVTIHRFERLTLPQESSATTPAAASSPTVVSVVDFEVEVDCSSGTYIRALARDLGDALGCGAHLVSLRRTRVGCWTLADAVQLSELPDDAFLTQNLEQCALPKYLTLSQAALRIFPRAVLEETDFEKFLHGMAPKTVLSTDFAVTASGATPNLGSQKIYAAVSVSAPTTVGGLIQVKSNLSGEDRETIAVDGACQSSFDSAISNQSWKVLTVFA